MRRVLFVLMAVILATVAFAAPVAASEHHPRQLVPLEELGFEFAVGEVCEFGVGIEYFAGTVTHTDLGTTATGVAVNRMWFRATSRLTNLTTGESIELVERAPAIVRQRPDGSGRASIRGTYWTYYFAGEPSDLGQGLWYVENGLTIDYFDAEGNLVNGETEGGTVTDLCAALS